MPVYQVQYTADGMRNMAVITARSEKAAVRKCKSFFKRMGYEEADVNKVKRIE